MFVSFVFALISSSSVYEWEMKRGLSVEAVSGYNFTDKLDSEAALYGLRVSSSLANQKDAYFAPELEFVAAHVINSKGNDVRNKFYGAMNMAFHEFFHPYAFRLALGAGTERRKGVFSPMGQVRFGFGRYFNSSIGAFVELNTRTMYREEKMSPAVDAQLSLRALF